MAVTHRQVVFKAYDSAWPIAFTAEHFGSTSIPGLSAKPIIDILVEARDLVEVDRLNENLSQLGYTAQGEHGISGRRYFRKGTSFNHTHHVHVYQTGNPNIGTHIAFRAYLVAHPTRAADYKNLKEELSKQCLEDPAAYQEGKAELCKQIVAEALRWVSTDD